MAMSAAVNTYRQLQIISCYINVDTSKFTYFVTISTISMQTSIRKMGNSQGVLISSARYFPDFEKELVDVLPRPN